MIKPLQNSSINFKGSEKSQTSVMSPLLKERLSAVSDADYIKFKAQSSPKLQAETAQSEKKEKTSFFNKFLNFIKGTNKNLNMVAGAAKGVVIAIPATIVAGSLFKNVKENAKDGALSIGGALKSICGVVSDGAAGIFNAGKFVLNLKDKSVKQALGDIITSPKIFYREYMKDHKGLAAAASAIGIGVIAFNVVKARLSANKQNSDIDHTFYTEHKV